MNISTELLENFSQIQNKIKSLARQNHRSPESIQLIAVSKGQSVEKIKALFDMGQKDFGENYLQELEKKSDLLATTPIRWHFIGHLQSNKIRKIVKICDAIHTVSDLRQARTIAKAACEYGKVPFSIYLSINISQDPKKSGCAKEDALNLAADIQGIDELTFKGFMAVPSELSATELLGELPQEFKELRDLSKTQTAPGLSLGMSNDMAFAIESGSTAIRLGTAIFGPRSYP